MGSPLLEVVINNNKKFAIFVQAQILKYIYQTYLLRILNLPITAKQLKILLNVMVATY